MCLAVGLVSVVGLGSRQAPGETHWVPAPAGPAHGAARGSEMAQAPARTSPGASVYHRYLGNLHSHTSYSDGKGTPAQAFQYARDEANVDFLAVTDHNIFLSDAEYADILHQAEVFNQDHSFVAIAGQEWTGASRDHINILEADHVVRIPYYQYDSLYSEIAASGWTANFNHPLTGLFNDYAHSPVGDTGISSVEVRWIAEEEQYIKILNNGWHVGADGSQDNHSPDWGNGSTWTVALACSLTREEILAACRDNRTYSTADRDLDLVFTAAGHWMGETFSLEGNVGFSIGVHEAGAGDSIVRIDLYQNGFPIARAEVKTDSVVWEPEITPPNGENYYFVRVCQENYKRTYSSPMWIECTTELPSTPALCSPPASETWESLTPIFAWHPSDKAGSYVLQCSRFPAFPPGPSTMTVTDIADTCCAFPYRLADGQRYWWRVWAVSGRDTSLCSATWWFLADVEVFAAGGEYRLTTDTDEDIQASILESSTALWLVWSSDRDGDQELFSKTSEDGGETWSDDQQLTYNACADAVPSITETLDGDLWLVWSRQRTGSDEIYYMVFDGASWSEPARLTRDQSTNLDPCVVQTPDGVIWVVWSSDREDGNLEIYCQTLDGFVWSSVSRLTVDSGCDTSPQLVSMGDGTLWLMWVSDRSGYSSIYHKVFDGLSWSDDMMLVDSDGDSECPSATRAEDGQIWLVYGKDGRVFYRVCIGGAWSDEAQVPAGPYSCEHPSVTQSTDGRIWMAYTSTRDSNNDVYARPTIGSLTAGADPPVAGCPDTGIMLWPCRPNPFCRETSFRLTLPRNVVAEVAVFDILGRKVRTLVSGGASAGEHVLDWDGRDDAGVRVSSGVYLCRMTSGRSHLTRKVIVLK
jgi:hypothetical protein